MTTILSFLLIVPALIISLLVINNIRKISVANGYDSAKKNKFLTGFLSLRQENSAKSKPEPVYISNSKKISKAFKELTSSMQKL